LSTLQADFPLLSNFLVYRASAGSGKTFRLVRTYLEQVFRSPADYRKILAVTFTNKAADEMKSRILDELDLLHRDPARSKHQQALEIACGFSGEALQLLAGRIKMQMLHDYSRISIGTIDHFFQQVLRSFARESGLSSTFQLELDSGFVLKQFSRYVFAEAATNPGLMSWLADWVNDRMDNAETWHRLETDLEKLGRELLMEDILAGFIEDPSTIPSQEQIAALKAFCRRSMKEFIDQRSAISKEATELIGRYGMTIEDFSGGLRGPAGCLVKMAGTSDGPTKTARESLGNPDKWVIKKKPEPMRSIITTELYPVLNDLMEKAITHYDGNITGYNSCAAVNRNLFALGFTSFLFDFFRVYSDEHDQLLLGLTQPIISQIIGDNPSPFLFEKTGNYYSHFLIDEFQDTSDLQWKNFRPLIVDSLSAGGLSMIVGDIKQSLYRWRNSNWRLLHRTAVNDLKAFRASSEPLTENQRSRNSVIRFNNLVFSALPDIIQSNLDIRENPQEVTDSSAFNFRDVYSEARQEFGRRAGEEGRVEVRFYNKTDKEDPWEARMESDLACLVEDLLVNRGYRQEDITFLVRRNREGDLLTSILTRSEAYQRSLSAAKWNFVSADVFRIGLNPVIEMIIRVLHFLADNTQSHYRDLFLWDYYRMENSGKCPEPDFRTASADSFSAFMTGAMHEDLLTFSDKLIKSYHLDREEDDLPYLFQFRDQVKGCMNKGISHAPGFLEWWDALGSRQMLASESPGSSMRIMTIHKAKGLSSPVVIIPFCSWDFNHSATKAPWLWVSTAGTPFSQVAKLPVKYESSLAESWFADRYSMEKADAYLDALNILYVGFTRAEDILMAFCPYGNKFSTVADALRSCLAVEADGDNRYRDGDPEFHNRNVPEAIADTVHYVTPMVRGNMKSGIAHRTGPDPQITRFGLMVHGILEKVIIRDDLADAMAKAVESGEVKQHEACEVENHIRMLLEMPEISGWFSGDWEILAEAGIIVPGKGERRPDRVMIRGNEVFVIDYKTGLREKRHDRQIKEYMELLVQLGYSRVRGFLLYLDPPELVEVKFPEGSFQPGPQGQAG
jgi:superfamily I DNA/RNA helicase